MKELSIEEKAKAYDEAVVNASRRWECGDITKDCLEYIFPELKESKDERIRKYLINQYKGDGCLCSNNFRISYEDIRAWFEKQGEHVNFLNKIQIGDKVTRNKDGMLVNLSQLNRIAKKDEKQGEQKDVADESLGKKIDIYFSEHPYLKEWYKENPLAFDGAARYFIAEGRLSTLRKQNSVEWSEEDERIRVCLIKDQEKALEDVRNDKYGHSEIISDLKEMYRERIDWLKSLKERYCPQKQWKPTEEQMEELHNVFNDTSAGWEDSVIESLYNGLKKLKEL